MGIRITSSHYAPFALALSSLSLIGAWIFEYGLGYAPCQMCYWQRYAHMGVIAISALVIVWQLANGESHRPLARKRAAWFIILAFFVSAFFALWHVGVEQGYIEALPSCSGGNIEVGAIDDILGSLDKKIKPPACSDVPWSLFGISMAGYNAILSGFGAAMGAFALGSPRR